MAIDILRAANCITVTLFNYAAIIEQFESKDTNQHYMERCPLNFKRSTILPEGDNASFICFKRCTKVFGIKILWLLSFLDARDDI